MAKTPSSYIETTGSTRQRTADNCMFPFLARPQPMSVYCRFVMLEVLPTPTVASAALRLWCIGANQVRRFNCYYDTSTAAFAVQHVNDTFTINRTTTATATVTRGQVVEVLCWLYADGSVNLTVSVNGGTATSGTQTGACQGGDRFVDKEIWLGGLDSGAGQGQIAIRDLLAIRGIHTLVTMRTRAGQ